ncbi:hypothetical protein [Rhizobium sp. NXC24]|uniref:hypothetical protein n=1 Tax=Rhizobium sp. NXC24 TaxID=2048897 RepID=UPI000CDF40C7|nr:hypothetical protein [Rhizobium sp. NXC24]AVA21197.1 hypothetical protein NXC24_CH01541 [Rhizobium sp. NXC24]
MSDYSDLLELFKNRRRIFVDQLDHDDEQATAEKLAVVQACITAIEAVMAEPPEKKTGPKVVYDAKGWPV